MEKELFYILQDIKGILNCINLEEYDEKIKIVENVKRGIEQERFENALERKRENLDYVLSDITTFWKYRKLNKMIHEQKKNHIDTVGMIVKSLEESCEREKAELIRQKSFDENKREVYKRNFDQIDGFLELCKTLTEEEKEKVFNYKMTSRGEYDDQLATLIIYKNYLVSEIESVIQILKLRETTGSMILENLNKILMSLAELSLAHVTVLDDDVSFITIILVLLALKNIISIILKDIKHLSLASSYGVLEEGLKNMRNELENINSKIEFLRSTPEEKIKELNLSPDFFKIQPLEELEN